MHIKKLINLQTNLANWYIRMGREINITIKLIMHIPDTFFQYQHKNMAKLVVHEAMNRCPPTFSMNTRGLQTIR